MLHMLALALGAGWSGPAFAQEAAPSAATELELLEHKVDRLAKELAQQRRLHAALKDEVARENPLQFEIEGTYHARGNLFTGLYDAEGSNTWINHRLRITPAVNYKDLAKLKMTIDGLENVVWGDNASLSSTALFAGNPSNNDLEGFTMPSIGIERLWLEAMIPLGQLRVGRQANNLGVGILANGGDGFENTFGEAKYGSTVDRVLFATRPVAIAQALAGSGGPDIPIIFAVALDRLVEEPLETYYGFTCEAGLEAGVDPDYDPRCDSNGDGLSDTDHSYVQDDREEEDRGGDWWARGDDDVYQWLIALIYRGEDLNIRGKRGDIEVGAFTVLRDHRQSLSKVVVLDSYAKVDVAGVLFQGEAAHIGGQTRAITLPGSVAVGSDDPLYKRADLWSYALRAGFQQPGWKVLVEHGYASGDENVADQEFTGRPMHPDYNVGLIIYEEVLARVTAATWTSAAEGLWSKGGVYNSRYLFPTVTFYPFDGVGETEVILGWLMAWPDKPDGAILRCREGDRVDCTTYTATQAHIGWELDLAIKHRWHEHLWLTVESGYAQITDRVALQPAGLDPRGRIFTLQSRIGWEF